MADNRVVRRLEAVQQKVQRIAAGDYAPIELPVQRDELYELSASVNRMASELQLLESRIHASERERLVHVLAAGLSHDLRNTLTGARLAIQLHEKDCTTDTESIAVAMRQLRLAKINSCVGCVWVGRRRPRVTHLDCYRRSCGRVSSTVGRHHRTHLSIERQSEWELITFPKAELLTSAILNLLLNAIQAAGEGGAVELRTCRMSRRGSRLRLLTMGRDPQSQWSQRCLSR